MANSAQECLGRTDFAYPLNCVLKISGSDKTTNNYVFTYERKITVQAGTLNGGLKLHLSKLTRERQRYRLAATAEDGQYIPFKSIILDCVGTVNQKNDCRLNTVLLEIDD